MCIFYKYRVIIINKMLNFPKKLILAIFVFGAFFTLLSLAEAQSVSNSISSISLTKYPTSARAGESVTISIFTDSLNLDSSKITWYVDGALQKNIGGKSLVIKNKSDGQITEVKAIVETNDGIKKEASIQISSSAVDLVVEPMAYTMPFYKGKPIFLAEGTIKVVAIPDIMIDGKKVSSNDLVFRWSKGGTVLGSNSGKGKNSIVITSTIPVRDISLNVDVLDSNNNLLASNSKIISKNTPTILLYEKNSLLGILYNKAIYGTYNLGLKEEITLIAKPFSFSFNEDNTSESNYVWYVNNKKILLTDKTNELILKQTGNTSGTTNISLNLNNINKINQYTNNQINIKFGN